MVEKQTFKKYVVGLTRIIALLYLFLLDAVAKEAIFCQIIFKFDQFLLGFMKEL